MDELIYVIINALAYVLFFYFFWKKDRSLSLRVYIIGAWTISACGAIFYEQVNIYGHFWKISLWPYIYLFVCVYLMFLPIVKYDEKKLKFIRINNEMLWLMAITIGLMSIPPFIESSIYYIRVGSNSQQMLESFNERYKDASTTYSFLSALSRRLTYILHSVRLLSLFMLFYLPIFKSRKHFKWVYGGVLLSCLMILVESMVLLARFQIISYALIAFGIYIIIRPLYDIELSKIIKKYLRYAFVAFGFVVAAQTANRFLNYQDIFNDVDKVTTEVYLAQYISESMGNFNGNLVHSDVLVNADGIMNAYTSFLGIDNRHLSGKTENRFHTNQFFTVVGDYWRTYGMVITFLIFIMIPVVFTPLFKIRSGGSMSIFKMLLLIMYIKFVIVGIFYNAYFVDNEQLLVMPLIMLLLSIGNKNNYALSR